MKKDQSKEDVRDRVLQAVISAEVSKGHLKWKVSEIARHTKVSRPLIYYHFGKTKKAILSECLLVIAEDYYGLTPDRLNALNTDMVEAFMRTRKMYQNNPALAVFYQKARMHPSELNDQLVEIEQRYQKKLKQTFPHLADDQIKGLHAIFHGLVTAPFLSNQSLKAALSLISFSGEKK